MTDTNMTKEREGKENVGKHLFVSLDLPSHCHTNTHHVFFFSKVFWVRQSMFGDPTPKKWEKGALESDRQNQHMTHC